MLPAIFKQKSGMHMVIAYVAINFLHDLLFAQGSSISTKGILITMPMISTKHTKI